LDRSFVRFVISRWFEPLVISLVMRAKTLLALSLFSAPLVGCAGQPGTIGSQSSAVSVLTPLIAQVYGGGANMNETLMNDYIVLYNPGTAAFSLNGYSVYVNSGTSTTVFTELALPTSGSIAAGGAYLISGQGGTDGTALPTADASSSTFSIIAGKGSAALGLSGTMATINVTNLDLVGWGAAPPPLARQGTAAPAMSIANALVRNSTVSGCTNAMDNATDFTLTTVTGTTLPPNSAATITSCSSFEPASSAPDMTTLTDGGSSTDDGGLGAVNDLATTIVGGGGEPTGNQPSATNGTGPNYKPGGTINGADTTGAGRGFNGCSVGGNGASTPWFAGLLVAGFALAFRRRRIA
jgi:MYXO-CTERM domain-containing protein